MTAPSQEERAAARAAARARIKRDVYDVLYVVRENNGEEREIDELDEAILDRAADALAVILFLDAGVKRVGKLSPSGTAIYEAACRERDAMLAALKIADPYRLPKGKLA